MFKKNENVIVNTVDSTHILFDITNKKVAILNDIAYYLFEHCEQSEREEIIANLYTQIENKTDFSRETVEKECNSALNKLIDEHFIRYEE